MSREDLTARVLPKMTLSSESNPLTAPLPMLSSDLSPAERALARFQVEGNAVSKLTVDRLKTQSCKICASAISYVEPISMPRQVE